VRKYYDPSGAVKDKGGPMVRHHRSIFDGSTQPYAIYVPASYTPESKWPLVISLHGYSSDHVLNLRRVFGMGNKPDETDDEYKRHFPPFPEIGFIVASPYGIYPNPLNTERYVVILGGRTPEALAKAAQFHRKMPDYAVFGAETDFEKPDTFPARGHFDGAWELTEST